MTHLATPPSTHRRRWFAALVFAVMAGPLLVPVAHALVPTGEATLPDLAQTAPSGVVVGVADLPDVVSDPTAWLAQIEPDLFGFERGTALRFHSRFRNVGEYAFEIVGAPTGSGISQPGIATMEAFQCARFEGPPVNGTARVCADLRPVGTMGWDPHHFHVHLEEFMRYSLHEVGADGAPGAVVASGDKVGYCMQDDTPWDPAIRADRSEHGVPNDVWWFARHGWYKGCHQPPMPGAMYRQGVSPGWNDTYYSPYPGQQVVIDDVPDGEYLLVNEVNPEGRFLEADRSNNRAWARIRLGTDADGERTVATLGHHAP